MMRRPQRKRGYFLGTLLLVLSLAAPVAVLLGWVLIRAISLQHLAAEHTNRVAVMDSLTRRLSLDALACQHYARSAGDLTLETYGQSGLQTVRYDLEHGVVRRTTADGDVWEWRARRLVYTWDVESGPRGDLLLLHFVEQPPPHASGVLPRTYVVPILLPPSQPAPTATEGGS